MLKIKQRIAKIIETKPTLIRFPLPNFPTAAAAAASKTFPRDARVEGCLTRRARHRCSPLPSRAASRQIGFKCLYFTVLFSLHTVRATVNIRIPPSSPPLRPPFHAMSDVFFFSIQQLQYILQNQTYTYTHVQIKLTPLGEYSDTMHVKQYNGFSKHSMRLFVCGRSGLGDNDEEPTSCTTCKK